ncbi:MAG: winged helix-turn-helix domain-containing protein [Elusimicrobiota bacterium]|jgi:hypothetical protein|nr:winged helix-turn-helix domain-containing protein [Elusimicrobiota bacterium]
MCEISEIGFAAGEIWKYLSEHGQVTSIKIKISLELSNTMLYLALGWLARENKIDIIFSDYSCKISLK